MTAESERNPAENGATPVNEASISLQETARVVLSGEYSRRRGYLTSVHTTWDGLALTGTLAIWGLLVQWYTLGPDPKLFATQIAWASALSSVLLGLWRLYARQIDDSIIKVYPAMYLCERAIVPDEVCTFRPPSGKQVLTQEDLRRGVTWINVRNADFGGRGHSVLDWIAAGLILGFGVITVVAGSRLGVVGITWPPMPHLVVPYGWFLIGNVLGLGLVAWGWLWWRNQERKWPVPRSSNEDQNPRTA